MPPENYKQCRRTNAGLLIALVGPQQSGKTYSAMELATGLCNGEPFAIIDTEGGRAEHYDDAFEFEQVRLGPPFHPERYLEKVCELEKAQIQVCGNRFGIPRVGWTRRNTGYGRSEPQKIARQLDKT